MDGLGTTGAAADCALSPGNCTTEIDWPAATQAETYFTPGPGSGGSGNAKRWMGTFVANGQGTTGMLYRRNRYFNPNGGQFTQADPLGIAGGMNAFGFASGDPVNFSDPFGLYVDPITGAIVVAAAGQAVVGAGTAAAGLVVAAGASVVAAGAEVAGGALGVVYRSLRLGEDIANGLSARAPDAGNSAVSHVAGKRLSQWISTTKSLEVAARLHSRADAGQGLVKIELSKVTSQVLDISNGLGQSGMLSNWAKATQEVLIKNHIPQDAITQIK